MIVNLRGYFTDLWNILDLIKAMFLYCYIILQANLINKIHNIDPELQSCLDTTNYDKTCYPDSYYYP